MKSNSYKEIVTSQLVKYQDLIYDNAVKKGVDVGNKFYSYFSGSALPNTLLAAIKMTIFSKNLLGKNTTEQRLTAGKMVDVVTETFVNTLIMDYLNTSDLLPKLNETDNDFVNRTFQSFLVSSVITRPIMDSIKGGLNLHAEDLSDQSLGNRILSGFAKSVDAINKPIKIIGNLVGNYVTPRDSLLESTIVACENYLLAHPELDTLKKQKEKYDDFIKTGATIKEGEKEKSLMMPFEQVNAHIFKKNNPDKSTFEIVYKLWEMHLELNPNSKNPNKYVRKYHEMIDMLIEDRIISEDLAPSLKDVRNDINKNKKFTTELQNQVQTTSLHK